jgi:hypothetical protein
MAVNPAAANAAPQITGAIQQAAKSSGISFEYLLTTAQIESNLNPGAQAATSSAKGLYQFIEQTWLGTLKAGGAAAGYGGYADAISRNADGHYEVSDPTKRAAIMQLRSDPSASAMMAGAFTRANADQLQSAIGRAPSEGELYIAHFLGPDGAAKLIAAAGAQPKVSAADMFPQAAGANRSIFYDGAGRPRSAADVYAKLTGRFDVARANSFAPEQAPELAPSLGSKLASKLTTNLTANLATDLTTGLASGLASGLAAVAKTRAVPSPPPAAARPLYTDAKPLVVPPDTAGVTQAYAVARADLPPVAPRDSRPLFQSMFSDPTRKGVTQTVSSLWTPGASTPGSSSNSGEAARPLDLFTDIRPDGRKPSGGKTS